MAFIEFHYGPYVEGGIIKHRKNRLINLANYLEKAGHSVDFCPSIHYDTLEVIIALRVAFRCRITFLSQLNYEVFGINHDPTLVKAIRGIEETLSRVGRPGINIKVPGMYKGMFSISQDFGSGVIHNNSPEILAELMDGEEEEERSLSSDTSLIEKLYNKKSIKFLNI